jgi:hypothetical protein
VQLQCKLPAQVQQRQFHRKTGLLTLMTSELQRQWRDITDRLAPPTASSTAAVSLQQVQGRGAVSEPGAHPQQAPCWRQRAARSNFIGSRDHRPSTHLSRCMTLPLYSGSGMRCMVRTSCPASSRYSSCCRLAATVLPQQVHLPPAGVAPADQPQDWQLHVQDVVQQQVSQRTESAHTGVAECGW